MSDPTTDDATQPDADPGMAEAETDTAVAEEYGEDPVGDDPTVVATEEYEPSEEQYVLEAPTPGGFVWGTGRRKSSIARVRIAPGSGNVQIKRSGGAYRELNDYFQNERDRKTIFGPLEATQYGGKVDIFVNTEGGGSTGQAGAIVMGLARALGKYDPQCEPALRENGYLTRDSRMKERKKYGQRGARRRFQFSKR
jgi:small subunit ribosomal protein S9